MFCLWREYSSAQNFPHGILLRLDHHQVNVSAKMIVWWVFLSRTLNFKCLEKKSLIYHTHTHKWLHTRFRLKDDVYERRIIMTFDWQNAGISSAPEVDMIMASYPWRVHIFFNIQMVWFFGVAWMWFIIKRRIHEL